MVMFSVYVVHCAREPLVVWRWLSNVINVPADLPQQQNRGALCLWSSHLCEGLQGVAEPLSGPWCVGELPECLEAHVHREM